MDVAVKQLRWKALNILVRAHKPGTIALPFLATTLGFLLSDSQVEAAAAGDAEAGKLPTSASSRQSPSRGSPSAAVRQLRVQLAALTVDEQGKLLSGCSEHSCSGENTPASDQQEGLQACVDWCKRHGADFDHEAGETSAGVVAGNNCLLWSPSSSAVTSLASHPASGSLF